MNVVKSTTIVADELNEINSLIDIRARKLRVKERELKDKIKAFKLWEKGAYEALRHHAETLMRHAILRIKNIVEKHASQAKTVLDTSESVMNLCNEQKAQIQKLSHAVKEPQRLLKVYKSRLDSERRRGKFLRRRVTQIEKENNRLRDMCHYESICKETGCNVTATSKLDSSLAKSQMNPSSKSTDNVYKTQNLVSQRLESSPHMTPKECHLLCKNNSDSSYDSLLHAEGKINKCLASTESRHQSPPILKAPLRRNDDAPSFSSCRKTTEFHSKHAQTYECFQDKKKENNVDTAHIFPKFSNFRDDNSDLDNLQEEKPWKSFRGERYQKRIFMPGHLNLTENNVSTTIKRQNEQYEGLSETAKNKVKQKNTTALYTSRQVLSDSQTSLCQSTQLKKKHFSKQNVEDLWTNRKVAGLPFQPNVSKSEKDLKNQYTRSFELSTKESPLAQPFVQYNTRRDKSSQLRSITLPPVVSISKPKRNDVSSLSIPPTINATREKQFKNYSTKKMYLPISGNDRMFTMLPQIDSDRQIVESATMLQKLANRIKIKKMLQSVKI